MGVGRQSRRVCFGAKPDKGFLDKKISPYPEVVRGPENESWRRGPERGKDQQRQLAWIHGGAVNTRHRAERRGDKKGPVKKSLKMSNPSSIVEFSLVTHASDSPYIYYQECICM